MNHQGSNHKFHLPKINIDLVYEMSPPLKCQGGISNLILSPYTLSWVTERFRLV